MRESFGNLDSPASRDARHLSSIRSSGNPSNHDFPPSEKSNEFRSSHLREQVLEWLDENVPVDRLQHILRVEAMAVKLAHYYQLDGVKAAQAGLMHDLAKFFKPKRLLQIAEVEGLEVDPVLRTNPHLLHAEAGAIVARDKFGIRDEEVLEAIRNHTLGNPKMPLLSCVVFLADSLEPGRGNTSELDHLRQLCWQNLHLAVCLTCDYSLRELMAAHRLIHPRMVLTRNWAMEVVREGKGLVGEKGERLGSEG
ncbi:bis(5'-nucleosyl)-tetraphosphatase (symmetrical) YqeK [Kovacikia minuta CCNUW1]|uniref:bis(5'-nucleosyl)-tetraphosphatase (symmetrical) YqeK n=1 Tax=Kovacikia minuta TaxID=2931930 RepID=UPI001CC9A5D5|nr:bis(5'-nucleosyl)-tetraphosphatase (symmetrical) YqeK [Kovacikia minuta]UBF28413.1 bis(5'-nucleosyl)-tetraphosphatase (symmetrical) YqeK [Kovacikia minuta CCNUW1]